MAKKKVKGKFKSGDTAYFFNASSMPMSMQTMHSINLLMVSAWIIHFKMVKGKLEGYTIRSWSELKNMGRDWVKAMLVNKISDEKIAKLKDTDYVLIKWTSPFHNLLTKEELKMEMIKWIANDFDDPSDHGENY